MTNKRLISIMLSFVVAFTSLISILPAGKAYASAVVLYEEDYAKAVDVLNAILPQYPAFEAENVKRAEFVAAVTMLLGKNESSNIATDFSDVPAEHKYSGNIQYAKDFGLISSADSFYPDSPVTYAQALKIILCATGHGMKAELTGGFPSGYLKLANEMNIGQNLNLGSESALTSDEASMLIFEAACTDILDVTSYGDSYEYAQTEGKNILAVYHKIYIAEGIADANKSTGLYSASANMDSKGISINGNQYYGDGYGALLGKRARVFFKGEKKREIIAAYPVENTIYSYTHEDALELSENTINAIRNESTKDERYSLENDYTVIFNGKYFAAAQNTYNDAINPESGMVELIDNDKNSKIDVISIKSIEYGVVDSINEIEGKIYDRYKINAMRVLSDEIDYSIVGSDGEILELSDLTRNTVVGYAESKDGKALEIIKYTGKIGGTYTELGGDVINLGKDRKFKLSKYFTENIKELSDLKLGSKIIAYLGMGNQVVYVEEYIDALSYGFLVDYKETGTGLNVRPCAKIYGDDGEMHELYVADKLIYNDENISVSAAKNKLENLKTQEHIMRVIRFSVNDNGELNKLYETVVNEEGINTVFNNSGVQSSPVLFDDNKSHGGTSGKLQFKYGVFYPYFGVKSGAVIMQVPSSTDDEVSGNAENYRVYSLSEISARSSNEQNENWFGYDVTQEGVGFVLWKRESISSDTVDEFTKSGVVESVNPGINQEGESVKVVKLYIGDQWKVLYSPAQYKDNQAELETTINNIKPGDIIRVESDEKNTITACRIDFSYVNDKTLYEETMNDGVKKAGYHQRYVGHAAGYIYSVGGNKAIVFQGKKSVEEIEREIANSQNLQGFGLKDIYPVNLASGTTVFVELKRDRNNPNNVVSAEVYKEANTSNVESYFTAGKDADYIVSRARLHAVSLNVIYVN